MAGGTGTTQNQKDIPKFNNFQEARGRSIQIASVSAGKLTNCFYVCLTGEVSGQAGQPD